MTDKYIEISKEAAEVARVEAFKSNQSVSQSHNKRAWLVHDNGACAELATEYLISTIHDFKDKVVVEWFDGADNDHAGGAFLADHNNDRMLATNYAILSAVIRIEKSEDLARIDDSDLAEWHGNRDCR